MPALVPRAALQPAIALNSLGINIARAVGPALAGVLIATAGIAAPFAANALSVLVIVAALLLWHPVPVPTRTLPPEPILGAMLTGLRHAAHNGPLKATLLRSFGFVGFASAYWALLPLVARGLPGGGAEFYGLLLGTVGAGAVAGALTLPPLRRRLGPNRLTAGGTVLTAAAMIVLALACSPVPVIAAALAGGFGWIAVLTSLNVSAQTALPNWVRARGLAIALTVFFGSMAVGAAIWGQVAAAFSVPVALLIAATGMLAVIPLTRRARLGQGEARDLTAALAWAEPVLAPDLGTAHDRGPVLVTIRYAVDPADVAAFLTAVTELSAERYRDGAYQWGISQDAAEPGFWLEWFLLPSWAEHLRQHDRATAHDLQIHARTRAFHRGSQSPEVRHYLAPPPVPGDAR